MKKTKMVSESQTTIKLPILDISQPLHLSSLSSLSEACKEWGFFQIKNHGIPKDLLYNKIKSFSKDIFTLPLETKLKLGPSSFLKTYTPHFIASPFFESLRVSGPDFAVSSRASFDHIPLSAAQIIEFSEILQDYGSKVTEISKGILKLMLMSIGDNEFLTKYYDCEFKNCHGYLRINNYSFPKSLEYYSDEEEEEEEIEGLGMHTDMSCITIVYQDEVGGLQVKSRDGKWMDILPCEGTLVVNIGDMLQAWSNDKFLSSEHKVILKKQINRFSLSFFWCFEDDKVVDAPDEVVGKGNLRMYKPFVCLDYIRFRENNEKGKFEKVGFTVKDFAGIS